MSEAEIIYQCQRNDKKAQRLLFEMYYDKMMRVSMRYAKNNEQGRDIFMKAFRFVIDTIGTYNSKNHLNFEEWIKKQFIHFSIGYLKANKLEYYVTTTVKVDDKRNLTDLFHQSEGDDPNTINAEGMLKALQRLPSSFRVAYNMKNIDGFDVKGIAEAMDVSEGSISMNLEKGNHQLLQNIKMLQNGYQ